jgi:hypothetical protein
LSKGMGHFPFPDIRELDPDITQRIRE